MRRSRGGELASTFPLLSGVVREDEGKKRKPASTQRRHFFLVTAFVDSEEEMGHRWNMACVFLFRKGLCKLRGRSARTPLVLAANTPEKEQICAGGHNPPDPPAPN